jgi:DNA-binding NtrC family response regulator
MKEPLNPTAPLLLVDDEDSWLNSLSFMLEFSAGFNNIILCQDSREVMGILSRQPVAMILLDLTMPHLSGEDVLAGVVQEYPEIPVVILSGMNQLATAVQCMRQGAADYFVKTVEKERLIAGIRRILSIQGLQQENRKLRDGFLQDRLENPEAFSGIVTRCRRMFSLFQYIEAVACSSEPILITGESGVGKELFARAAHDIDPRQKGWVALNVAGLDDNVFSDALFGHVRGAFTGADKSRPGMIEKAAGGVLFLDEIGDLSLASQVKLLRFLQEGEYLPLGSDTPKRTNVRIIVATNHDLDSMQARSAFRKDLYYRLCSHRIHVPPLRERKEDIPLLLDYFLEEAARIMDKRKPTPPEELPVLLSTYHFPGNVRELRAMIYNAVSMHRGGKLSMAPFKAAVRREPPQSHKASSSCAPRPDESPFSSLAVLPTLSQASEILVEEVLRRSRGNQTIAAGLLGISRQALSKRLKQQKQQSPSS